ncbi:MAG: transcription-repair coupling factor [Candidatus Brocadiales bacterium]
MLPAFYCATSLFTMPMKDVLKLLLQLDQFKRLKEDIRKGISCGASGLWGSSSAYLLSAIAESLSGKDNPSTLGGCPYILLITPTVDEAEESFWDINLFHPDKASLFPAREDISSEELQPDTATITKRLNILQNLLSNAERQKEDVLIPHLIVAPIQALLQDVPSGKNLIDNSLLIRKGEDYKLEKALEWLKKQDFTRVPLVEMPGEFSLRGGILDIYPYSSNVPYRIEFFGDNVESIRVFDVETQSSKREIKECQILTVQKNDQDKAQNTLLLDYLPSDTLVVLKEPEAIKDRARKICVELNYGSSFYDDFKLRLKNYKNLNLSRLPIVEGINSYIFHVDSIERFNIINKKAPSDITTIINELSDVCGLNTRTIVFCNNEAEKQRLHELSENTAPDLEKRLELRIGHLSHGFQFKDISVALIPHHEIFRRYKQRREPKSVSGVPGRAIDSFLDLKKGDYIVHVAHGIGKFLGIETLKEEEQKREFLVIEFDEDAKVYVPATRIELVQKYIGGTERPPRLSKVGGQSWVNTKQRAEKAVADLASELLHIQAVRDAMPGMAYPKDNEWQREFEAEFIYEETEDQLRVADEIKRDMESPRPMDRLICGDVGYGKTELAIRAVFKAVMSGKQVAVLVPTTILAQQHYRTFSERMADYPIQIDVLSRFRTHKEQKEILERVAKGQADIVIGTHRLVQKDVRFKDLGLVIIDEEQRFGVEHKERLKRLRSTVEVLTLTATPIPRTLHMSLLGIRDISSLNTPPQDRLSIHTRLMRFEPKSIRQVILHELNRDGQVYFVHNRIYNIERIAEELSKIVPEARIAVAHGQMPEKMLERRMLDFVDRKFDILVSTTIIESGLDIPTVNTIFINCAEMFGLADLHQLRGRVGRYKHRAYAYLLISPDRPITPEAEKRLKAIEEFAELGAGFKIAMRDLEIRGAGNMLGTEQHGHIVAVGYEMYRRLLEIAVKRAKNEPITVPIDVSITLNLDSYLPDDYIPDGRQKMEIYRKLNRSNTIKELRDVAEELRDRFGPLPSAVKHLLSEGELRIAAQASKIQSLVQINGKIILQFLDFKKVERCLKSVKNRVRIISEDTLHILLPQKNISPEGTVDFLKKILRS